MASGKVVQERIELARVENLIASYYPTENMVRVEGMYQLEAERQAWSWILTIPGFGPPFSFAASSNGYAIMFQTDGIIQTTSVIPKDTQLIFNLSWPKI